MTTHIPSVQTSLNRDRYRGTDVVLVLMPFEYAAQHVVELLESAATDVSSPPTRGGQTRTP